MKQSPFVEIAVLLTLGSCGLETVPTLQAPNIDFLNQTLVTDTTLSLIHDSDRYSGTDFLGYEIFYKIYPLTGVTRDFARLVADRDSVNLSPTVSQLTNLGYSQMTSSLSNDLTKPSPLNPILINPPAGARLTLDFTPYTTVPFQPTDQPELKINGIIVPNQPYLFRNALSAGQSWQSFLDLWTSSTNSTRQVDMSAVDINNSYDINVFIVAYGPSATLQAIYSPPVPWGVIRKTQ